MFVYASPDLGFYTLANKIPNCFYYYIPNIENIDIIKTQEDYLYSRKPLYVISKNKEFAPNLYEIVLCQNIEYEGIIDDYYLYKLIS